jgi:hypothetical protein
MRHQIASKKYTLPRRSLENARINYKTTKTTELLPTLSSGNKDSRIMNGPVHLPLIGMEPC